ncbi:MAG: amidohydrolase [Blautia sp.]|nr:amidohydrolase [Blautia sp.]
MNYKFTGAKLLLYQNGRFSAEEKDLYVADGVIQAVLEPGEVPDPVTEKRTFTRIDASGRLIMPGLINMHTHAYMTLLRNYADDVDFGEWLFNRISPAEDRITPEDAYAGNLLAFAEMIRSGTTSYVDMHMFKGQSSAAASAAGMRAFIGRGLVGNDLYTEGLSRFEEALEEQAECDSTLISFTLAPHAIYTCSPKFYEQVAKEAEKRGMLKQTHLSESRTEVSDCLKKYGKTPVEIMQDTGFLDGGAILAHCVHMQPGDIEIIQKSGSTVVTNPASNAKLGNGFAPVKDFLNQGVNLCLGTDGTASNNTLNMFREMGLLSLIHKGISEDPTALSAQQVLKAVTVNAAKALGQEDRLGVIKEGAEADLIFLDLKSPNMYPLNDVVSSLVYSSNGSEVCDVMIQGRFVMKNRSLTTIDLERVYRVVERYKSR